MADGWRAAHLGHLAAGARRRPGVSGRHPLPPTLGRDHREVGQAAANFDSIRIFLAFLALSVPFDLLLAVGWAAAINWWTRAGPMPALKARVAAAGRMAFTNYLMTSIVMTTIFYGYGLGLFGHVGRAEVYLFVIGMWALMLAWSQPWLARFQYGPFEWLWRSLARLRLQSMRRTNRLATVSQYP